MITSRSGSVAFVVLALAATLAGCARTRPFTPAEAEIPSAYPDHSVRQIAALVDASSPPIAAFRARAALSIDSPERSGRFSTEIRQRRDDSLYLSISPGFGIEAVRILLTRDSVFVYDRIDNRVRYGSSEDAEALLPLPIGGDAVSRALLGQMVPEIGPDWEVRADSNHYFLTGPGGEDYYVVDPSIWRVVRYELRDPSGALREERTFQDFSDVEGHIIPRRLVFRRPQEASTLVLTYRDIDASPGSLSFDLSVRDGARWTPVSDR